MWIHNGLLNSSEPLQNSIEDVIKKIVLSYFLISWQC